MNIDDAIMKKRNMIVHSTIKEIKIILADCSLSELEKIDEIEAVVKLYKEKQ